ncbi:hypothetical protein F5Y13DRAFT_205011 [Hypoxylon sp. FL1857]|nr:hypothetical protein F5Y13DRAFT_205011 [Hypoxylon sp. FL1857]
MGDLTPYEQIARTETSLEARSAFLPPLSPACFIPYILRHMGEGEELLPPLPPPQSFKCESHKFGGYGQDWLNHIREIHKWYQDINDNIDLPLRKCEVLAGNRLTCLDYLCDHVVCPNLCLRVDTDTLLFKSECLGLLSRRFLLIPYEEDSIFVNIVYDRNGDIISTFDGVARGRKQRHDNAVRVFRALIERCGLPRIPHVESRMQSRKMSPGDERYNGYLALEGARIFLREMFAAPEDWRDWTASGLYAMRNVELITETQARVTWIDILDDACRGWDN